MTIYMYDPNTKHHTNSAPLRYRMGVPCMPPNATTIEPPLEDGYTCTWNGSGWDKTKNKPDPVQETPYVPTKEELAAAARDERNNRIENVQWRIQRYQEQREAGITTTDSFATYQALLTYVQDLRDVPAQAGFPETIEWPKEPE